MPTIPVFVISKILLPQSSIIAAFVHSNSSFFCLSRPANIKQSQCHTMCSVLNTVTCCWHSQTPAQSVQLPTYISTLHISLLMTHSYFVIIWFPTLINILKSVTRIRKLWKILIFCATFTEIGDQNIQGYIAMRVI